MKKYYSENKLKWTKKGNRTSWEYDWLHLQLGNKCSWCERTSQEIKIEIDHIIPVFRNHFTKESGFRVIRDYFNGEPLRLLCVQCHKSRHTL